MFRSAYKRTSPSGPWCNTAPWAFSGENWKVMLGFGFSTLTPNDTCESSSFSKKAMFAQDLVRSQPVTNIISSIRSIPSPSFRAKANQLSMYFTIHNLKSPCERVSSRRAATGRDNTAAPRVLLCLNVTCGISPGLGGNQPRKGRGVANRSYRE